MVAWRLVARSADSFFIRYGGFFNARSRRIYSLHVTALAISRRLGSVAERARACL
jgi:hypothetical protein